MLSINIFSYIFNMMTISRCSYTHILACIAIYMIKCLMEFIYKDNIVMSLQLKFQIKKSSSGKE